MSQAGSTLGGGGGGGGVIQTIAGDTGSITGANVTIFANNSTNNAGGTVSFDNSGTVSTFNVTSLDGNTFVGKEAGNNFATSADNTAFGRNCMGNVNTGSQNSGFGIALGSLNNGNGNVSIGNGSLSSLTDGSGNISMGYFDCSNLVTGNNNITLNGGVNYTTSESNNIIISNVGIVGESNKLRIGTSGSGASQVNETFVAGITGVTVAASEPVAVASTGQLSGLGFGTAAQVLTSNGAGVSPTFQAIPAAGTTCLFSAYRSSTVSNVTGDGTVYTIVFDSTLVNLGSAYNTGTGVFTAPTTGNYMFSSTVNIEGLLTGHTEGIFSFNGSTYENRFARYNMGAMATGGVFSTSGSFIIPMTAGDTMSVFAFVTNSTKVVDVVGAGAPATYTNFSGYLIP